MLSGQFVRGVRVGHAEAIFRGTRRFQVVRRLGAGGMGVVYEALDRDRGEHVALKVLPQVTGEALLRFKHEFRAAQEVVHPGLVRLGELFEERGAWFFTMELVAGVDFLAHVRGRVDSAPRTEELSAGAADSAPVGEGDPGGALDEGKLRSALAGLLQSLAALHGAGLVHRDVKRSNVLVTAERRVVLLDLGLVQALGDRSTGDAVVGTVAYMAPEQAAQAIVGPAADLYAPGVMLYEALAGRLPFSGPALAVLLQKQRDDAKPPSAFATGLAPDLETLCLGLLAREPDLRPNAAAALAQLGGPASEAGSRTAPSTSGQRRPLFVGRAAELSALATAFDETRCALSQAVLVEGESGMGKSALVRRFIEELGESGWQPVVLAGRCYERESVPYKAWDGIFDALSRTAQKLGDLELGAILPRHVGLLVQVFPVLRRVRGFLEAAERANAPRVDPQEQRSRVFGAVRDLLARLGEQRPLVLVVDDLQWADRDSFALLEEVLREPDAPRLLFVGTARRLPEEAAQVRRALRLVPLGPLPQADAESLAAQVLATVPASDRAAAATVAREAAGHPLYIDELARFSRAGETRRLDDALAARVRELPPAARLVMELLAVAGSPIERPTLVAASGITGEPIERALALLRSGRLLRGDRSGGTVEPYHDRVREAVAGGLDPDVRVERHLALAHALEAPGDADPDVVALHWRAAGEAPRAVPHYLRAAEAAETAVAFDRAVACYRAVLELPPEHPERRRLRVRLADALANAGRGAEAAREYTAATAEAPDARTAMRLERLAVENHLKAGDLVAGRKGIRRALAAVRLKAPRSAFGSLLGLLVWRAVLRLRGLGFVLRSTSDVPDRALDRIDTCWMVGTYLISVDTAQGMMWTTRALLLSLRAGEPTRLARSLAVEAFSLVCLGSALVPRARRILEIQHPLVRPGGDPYGWALNRVVEAATLLIGLGRWREGLERSEEACKALREGCTGVSWECVSADCYRIFCLYFLGRLGERQAVQSQCLMDSDRRGDLYGSTFFRTSINAHVWLVRDDPEGALGASRSAVVAWPERPVLIQHLVGVLADAQALLYAKAPTEARALILDKTRGFERAFLLRLQIWRVLLHDLLARATLAEAIESAGQPQGELLGQLRRQIRSLRRKSVDWANRLGDLLDAQLALVSGDTDRAIARYHATIEGLTALDMVLHAAVARFRLGQLLGGDEGRALREQSEAYFRREGVVRPDRFIAMLAPVPGDLRSSDA